MPLRSDEIEVDVDNWELFKVMVGRGWDDGLIGSGIRAWNSHFPDTYADNILGEDFRRIDHQQQLDRLTALYNYNRMTTEERSKYQTGVLDQEHQEDLRSLGVDPDKLSIGERIIYGGGYIAGAMADPVALAPLGLGFKAAVKGGTAAAKWYARSKYIGSAAAIGAADAVARVGALDYAEDGTLNQWDDIQQQGAVGAAIGASLGMVGLGWKLFRMRQIEKAKAGLPVDGTDAIAAYNEAIAAGRGADVPPELVDRTIDTMEQFDPDYFAKTMRIMSDNMATQEELLARGAMGSYVNRGAQDSYKRFMARWAVQRNMTPGEMASFLQGRGAGGKIAEDQLAETFIEFEAQLLKDVAKGSDDWLVKNMDARTIETIQDSIDAYSKRLETTADFLGHSAHKVVNTKNVDEVLGDLNFFNETAAARIYDDIQHGKVIREIADERYVPAKTTDPLAVNRAFQARDAASNVKAEKINPQRWAERYKNDPDRVHHIIPTSAATREAFKQRGLEHKVEELRRVWTERHPWEGRDFSTEYMKQADLDALVNHHKRMAADAAPSATPEIPDAPWIHPEPSRPWTSMADLPTAHPRDIPPPSQYLNELADEVTSEIAENIRTKPSNQAGFAEQALLRHMGLSSAGALAGFATTGDIEGALMGIGLVYGGGWVLRRTLNALRKSGKKTGPADAIGNKLTQTPAENQARTVLDFNDGMARHFRRAHKVFAEWGPTGKGANEMMRRFDAAVTMATSRSLHSLIKVANKAGISQKDLAANTKIIDYMTRRIGADKLSAGELAVAKELDRTTMHILNSLKKTGAITPQHYMQIVADRKRRGFWPIVINEGYLLSNKGKAQWMDTFTNRMWAPEELNAAIRVMVGEQFGSDDILRSVSRQTVKDAHGRVALTEKGARELLQRKILTPFSVIHSDSRQDLLASILRPFTVTDPVNAFTDFINFNYRRIAEHQLYGGKVLNKKTGKLEYNKHAYIINTAEQIFEETGSSAAKRYFLEQMYAQVGSMKSDIIRRTATQSRGTQWLMGKAKAINILKLGTASILNMTQALAAGTIRLARYKNTTPVIGVFKSFIEASHALVKALPREARMEVLGRTGAALETTRMQYVGEMAAISNSILPYRVGPLHWLNNPSEFLRVTGFNFVEEINRAAGANMGMAYAESLIAKKVKIETGLIKNSDEIASIYKQMDELGLPTRDRYAGVEPIHYRNHVERAGLFFSDSINFSNKTQNIPLAAQSPYAKMLLQFKTFQYHWGNFVGEHLLPFKREIAKDGTKHWKYKKGEGNLNALLAFLGPAGALGLTADEARRMIMADDRDFTMTETYLRGLGAVGGLGLISSTVESFFQDPTRPYELIGGPTISMLVESASGVGDVLSGKDTVPEQFRDFTESVVPVSKAVTRRLLD